MKKNIGIVENKKYIWDLLAYCKKIGSSVDYYVKQIKSYNDIVHHILKYGINLILLQLPTKQKCGIITTLVSGFTGLAYEGISSFVHIRSHTILHKALELWTVRQQFNIINSCV